MQFIFIRGGSRAAATSKMECFVIIVNGWKPLTTITKHSILDVAPALDPLLVIICQVGSYRNILKLAADHLLLPHVKLFKKTKRGLELVSLSHFLHNFWIKVFLLLYSINWPNFIVWLPSLLGMLDNICIVIIRDPDCDVINFEINLSFLIKPFST